MNFDNLTHYDLMNRLYRFIPFLSILLFWFWPYSLHCVIECVKEIKTHSVKTVEWGTSEVKRENRDLCKTKNVIQRERELKKKGERLNNSRLRAWRRLLIKTNKKNKNKTNK